MTTRIQYAFLLIAIFQTLHSLEEYFFALWDHLAPARRQIAICAGHAVSACPRGIGNAERLCRRDSRDQLTTSCLLYSEYSDQRRRGSIDND
jgi:hypothetical protein